MPDKLKQFIEFADFETHLIIDCRPLGSLSNGFVSGSVFGGFNNFYFQQLAQVFPVESLIAVVVDDLANEAVIKAQLESAGFKHIQFVVAAGEFLPVEDFLPLDIIISVSADELALDIPYDDKLMLVDVREASEFEDIHFEGAYSLPLSEMGDTAKIALLPIEANLYLYCTDGERSLAAATILKRHGFHNLRVVEAEWNELTKIKSLEIAGKKKINLN